MSRGRAIRRDDYRCTKCSGFGRLEVHHITSPLKGGSMFKLSNLTTLCRRCHFRITGKANSERMVSPELKAWRDRLDSYAE